MKRSFLVFILLVSFISIQAQEDLFGKYKFHAEDDEIGYLDLDCDNTFLLKDMMFITKDSCVTSTIIGTWKIRKSKVLILAVDLEITELEALSNSNKIRYDIRNGCFYLKLKNKRQYERQNKKYGTDTSVTLEDYKRYATTQNKCFFFKVDTLNCR